MLGGIGMKLLVNTKPQVLVEELLAMGMAGSELPNVTIATKPATDEPVVSICLVGPDDSGGNPFANLLTMTHNDWAKATVVMCQAHPLLRDAIDAHAQGSIEELEFATWDENPDLQRRGHVDGVGYTAHRFQGWVVIPEGSETIALCSHVDDIEKTATGLINDD
jgi:hypothetical protein